MYMPGHMCTGQRTISSTWTAPSALFADRAPFLMFSTEYTRLAALESLGSPASASYPTVR